MRVPTAALLLVVPGLVPDRTGASTVRLDGPSGWLAGPLDRAKARSRLYRIGILQVNMRLKAVAEIYTMHSFAPFSMLKIFVKNR